MTELLSFEINQSLKTSKIGKKYFVTEQDVKAFILAQETNVETVKTEEYDPYSGAIRED